MPADRAQEDRDAAWEARVTTGDPGEGRERVDVGGVQPPGNELHDRRPSGAADAGGAVAAEDGDAHRAGVEALRVGAHDGPIDAARATLEHLAVLVDEKVVADVVPAVARHVVELNSPHDRGRLLSRVVVRAGGVMDKHEADVRRECGRPLELLVRAPGEAADERRAARAGERAERPPVGGAPDRVRPSLLDTAAGAQLEPIGDARPVGVADVPATGAGQLGAAAVGHVLGLRGRAAPGAPVATGSARAERDAAGAAPVEGDHRERPRRLCERRATRAADGHVKHAQHRAAGVRRGRQRERGKDERNDDPAAHLRGLYLREGGAAPFVHGILTP